MTFLNHSPAKHHAHGMPRVVSLTDTWASVRKRSGWFLCGMMFVLIGCGKQMPVDSEPKANNVAAVPTEPGQGGAGPSEIVHERQPVDDATIASWTANKSLRRLKLAGSDIDDKSLEAIVGKCQLELLDLTGCKNITSQGIRALGGITTLRNLRVEGDAVNDDSVAAWLGLSKLAALSLQQTAVTDKGLAFIRSMPGLKELNLYGTPITDASLDTIASLPSLQKLRLRATKVTGASANAFADMKAVVDLDLSETDFVSNGLLAVAKMPNLSRLNLWLTKVDDSGIEYLENQTQLTLLNLDNVKSITDRSLDTIAKMKDLDLLHLGGTSVTSAGLPKLYGLKKLKTLFITRLNLSPEDVNSLREAMPWLTKLES